MITKGASVAINGTCLTITNADIPNSLATFDVIDETLAVTNLSKLEIGDKVNFERAAKFGDEIGGHLMSGHIHTTTKISRVIRNKDNYSIYFNMPLDYQKYLFPKGFVGLNGCSLTLVEVNKKEFSVHLIPETLEMTTFKTKEIDELVNLEIDSHTQAIVDTVARVLKEKN
jgi:riboflavin synthase